MASLPLRFQEVTKLPNLGINAASCRFNTLTMESERFICVREEADGQNFVVIVDMQDLATPPLRRRMQADSAIMNPASKVLALKSGRQLQIFNIEMKSKMKSHLMTDDVVYWRWISVNTIALVTKTAVYHWSADGATEPRKVFDRHPTLATTQIISYKASASEHWMALVGITAEENRVVGKMQLYSAEKNVSQPIDAHACCFSEFKTEGATTPSTVFVFANRSATGARINFAEVERGDGPTPLEKKAVDIVLPPDAATSGDFPVALQSSKKYGVVYMLTKLGVLYVYDIESAILIYSNRISADAIFTSTIQESTGGILAVNNAGQVLSVSLDPNTVVPYISNTLQLLPLAIKLASRCDLPGAEDLVVRQFSVLFQQGNYAEAARVAATSPQGILRTPQTIQRFQAIPVTAGQAPPLLQYFGILLDHGRLNKYESLELSKMVISQGKKDLLEKWLKESKLECSEELGDMTKALDINLSLSIYLRAEVPHKVIQCFAETGQYDKIVLFANKVGYKPDYSYLLQNIIAVDPPGSVKFALMLVQQAEGPMMDVNSIVDAFLQRNMVPQVTEFLLDVLKENKPEDGPLQTRVLEINLVSHPQVAEAILKSEMFSHYDRSRIAQLCEKAGLFAFALKHYSDKEIKDIRRVLTNAPAIDRTWLVEYFSTLSPENTLTCLKDLITNRVNMQVVVQTASKYNDTLTPAACIALFEKVQAWDGLFLYLQSIVDFSQDPLVHFKYIVAATKMNNYKEVERIVRDSTYYDPAEVKDFLKEAKLPDQLPLIICCDKYDFVDDLATYLYTNNMRNFIESYVQKVNTSKTPEVVGALLEIDASVDFIKGLLNSVRNVAPVEELTNVLQSKGKLKILQQLLETRINEGAKDAPTHNALAMIYVDSNNNAEQFLNTNEHYDPIVVGKHCEKRDPHLAFVAYKRGQCDKELVDVCQKNSMFKPLARYLVSRKSAELWAYVLDNNNTYRSQVVDQVVGTALPETSVHDEVSVAVKAFMVADLKSELIELLEKIVLGTGQFSDNKHLQNLLIITAIKGDPHRVMEYINRLNNYDAADIANIAVGAELYEEAFTIYKKSGLHVKAVEVLLDHLGSIERAYQYADKVADPEVWFKVGCTQLHEQLVGEAIQSFLKAENPQQYVEVIDAAETSKEHWEPLVEFLRMCKKKQAREPLVDTELVYALARTNRLDQLEEFVTGSNAAQLDVVGKRCHNEGMYQAAKTIFTAIPDYQSLANALLALQDYQGAVDAARSASNTATWKLVSAACVGAGEFRLAQICGLHLVALPDELDDVVKFYEERGYIDQLLALLDAALGSETAHKGLFTELAILYAKYKREKLMEHLKVSYKHMNIAKVLVVCKQACHWPELVFLYQHYDENDNAAITMMEHSTEAWDHINFKDVIVRVSNLDIYYRAIEFYLKEQPLLLNDLLNIICSKVDNSRVVGILRRNNALPLIKKYLVKIQTQNITAVNEALNDLYIEEEDSDALRRSISDFPSFDQLALAQRLEKHELLEMRRIAAVVYKNNKRHQQSIELSKKDKLFKDAMTCASESNNRDLAENLLGFFVNQPQPDGTTTVNKECFAACLYTCNALLRPDVVLELAWKHHIIDYAMPYMIQYMRETNDKIAALEQESAENKKMRDEIQKQQAQAQAVGLQAQVTGYGYVPQPQITGTSQYPAPQYTGSAPVQYSSNPAAPQYYTPAAF